MNELLDRVRGNAKTMQKLDKIDVLNDLSRKEQFLFALAFAINNEIHPKPIKKAKSFFHRKNIDNEDDMALINVVAYKVTNSLDTLLDEEKKIRIAEEYANAGILYLYDEYVATPFGAFEKELESRFFKNHSKLTKKSELIFTAHEP